MMIGSTRTCGRPLGCKGLLLDLMSGATAVMLARAIAASLRGLRSSNANSYAEAVLLPGLA